jgi:hypothetical protein
MRISLPSSIKPARKGQWLMHWTDDGLTIHPPMDRRGLTLNATAAKIWQLCDGTRSLQQMADELHQAGHMTTGFLEKELSETVKQLFHWGLVELKPGPVRPVLLLGFSGFTDTFDIHDNFFLNLFSEWIDILIVADDELPDILIVNSHRKASDEDISAPLFILLDEAGDSEIIGFDLVFTRNDGQRNYGHSAVVLPENYQTSHSPKISLKDKQKISKFLSSESEDNRDSTTLENTFHKKLTIGMATYDDYDGVYFTVQAIRMFHPEVTSETEILIVDNNPSGPCASHLQDLAKQIDGYRYIANDDIRGTAVRDFVFHEARTDYVMCIDSHVLIEPGAIRKLIDYFDTNPDTPDLLQGPMINDDLQGISTHFDPVWKQGMFGVWGIDERGLDPNGEPFDIPLQGLGLAACRKSSWQGYNLRFRGFGGEEGYIHQKFRNAGAKTLCLPFLRWLHRFSRPMGVPYENAWEDRIRNYLIGFEEVGLDTNEVCEHFGDYINSAVVERVLEQLANEKSNPFDFFDAIYCINMASEKERWLRIQRRLRRLGILHRVRRFEAIETPESHHIGCALSHRKIIEESRNRGYKNVLVLEDDALFHEKTLEYLRQSITELENQQWNMFYLGGMKWGKQFSKLPHCRHLERPQGMTCAHALAYNSSFYDKLLTDLPADIPGMEDWIKTHAAIDKYLPQQDGLVVMSPVIATQTTILREEDEKMRNDYY